MGQKVIYFSIVTALVSLLLLEFSNKYKVRHPYADLNVQELIKKYEYPVEVHEVTTEDGYVLTLHRVPYGKENITAKRDPILLVPGILQTAWDFVHSGPNRSLAFLLSEKGYDVWLGNIRGTIWSRRHKTLDPDKDLAFWNYTNDQIATYDLPAIIDYILVNTGQDSLHYVGFSQVTTLFFIMGAEISDYLAKIKLMTAFGPAVFLKNPKSPIMQFLANNWRLMEVLFSFFNYLELFGNSDPFVQYLRYICSDENSVFINLCINHIFLLSGENYDELDPSMLPVISSKYPCGGSLRQIVHMYQMVDSGNFCKYDFGTERNLEVYGRKTPPHYNLSKVTTPVALYYSSNDWVVDITNMDRLIKILPNVVKNYKVPSKKFNHGDFLYAINTVRLLYNSVVDEISKY